jgi:hypothetical protein
MEGVTIHAGGNMGFLETQGPGGHVYKRVRIIRNPNSDGLVALNADGFHSSDVGKGPSLEDSEISFTGDDFVNIHNRMLVVCEDLSTDEEGNSSSPTSLAILDVSKGMWAMRPGDTMGFYKLMPGLPHTANPMLARGVVRRSQLVTQPTVRQACVGAAQAMQKAPYNAKMVVTISSTVPLYRVDFMTNLSVAVTETRYNLANFEQRSGSHALVQRNHFHDSCGSGGRIMAKAMGGTYLSNVAERFGGFHITSEQEWLEGPLGTKNVHLENNTFVDDFTQAARPEPHIDVMRGLANITCVDTTFVETQGNRTFRAQGC